MGANRDVLLRPKRSPTLKQAKQLQVLGGASIALAPRRSDWGPLIRRGWIETTMDDDGSRYLPPIRITSDGLRALADAMDAYPEDLTPEIKRSAYPQLNELPEITRLKAKRDAYYEEAREAKAEAHQAKLRLARAQRALEGDVW